MYKAQKTYPIIPYLGSLLESNALGRMTPLNLGILYFSSVLFSTLATSFTLDKEIYGANAGGYGFIGGHIGTVACRKTGLFCTL